MRARWDGSVALDFRASRRVTPDFRASRRVTLDFRASRRVTRQIDDGLYYKGSWN